MAVITLPDNLFRDAQWTLEVPQQVNRSAWTGRRTVMRLPGAARWHVSASHVPIIGEAKMRNWRAALANLRGAANSFRMFATEGTQASVNPVVASVPLFINVANTTVSGTTITRASGSAWDGAAVSNYKLGPGGSVTFKASQNNKNLMVGFAPNGASAGFADLTAGLYLRGDTGVEVVSSGSPSGSSITTYSTTDVFRFDYDGLVARIYKNGTQLTVTGIATPFADLVMKVCLFEAAAVNAVGYTNGGGVIGLSGMPASANFLKAGQMLTFTFSDGSVQLVQLVQPLDANASGQGISIFEPTLRGTAPVGFGVEAIAPWCNMALDDSTTGWRVDPGQIYSIAITATEAF